MLSDYSYTTKINVTTEPGRVVYFSGCMTRLFIMAGEDYLWIDQYESLCCGRLIYLSGQIDAFRELAGRTYRMIMRCKPTRIVTNCPICLHTFIHDYRFLPIVPSVSILLSMITVSGCLWYIIRSILPTAGQRNEHLCRPGNYWPVLHRFRIPNGARTKDCAAVEVWQRWNCRSVKNKISQKIQSGNLYSLIRNSWQPHVPSVKRCCKLPELSRYGISPRACLPL